MRWAVRWIAPLAMLAVFFFLARSQIFTWPYYYDEADYMYAVSLGWQANFTDTPSQPVTEYIRSGLSQGREAGARADLSRRIRSSGDVNFYRHWHGPLYFYWLLELQPFGLTEAATRGLSYVFPVLTFALLYAGCLWLLPGPEGLLAGTLAGAFYLWSYSTVRTNEIAPHALFALCYIAALLLLMKWSSTGAPRYWYAAVLASACAFCTLEVAFVLIATLLVVAALDGKLAGGLKNARFTLKSLAVFFGAILLLWPSALARLNFVKAYLFMAYLAIGRESPWGRVTLADTWRLRLTHAPVEWLLIAASVVLYFRFRDAGARRLAFPALFYAGLMLVVLARVGTDTPRYMLPYLPAFHLFAGLTFAQALKAWKPLPQAAAAAVLCLLALGNTAAQVALHPIRESPRLRAELSSLRERRFDGKRLLVPQAELPMIHYYFPRAELWGYADESEKSAWLGRCQFDAVLDAPLAE